MASFVVRTKNDGEMNGDGMRNMLDQTSTKMRHVSGAEFHDRMFLERELPYTEKYMDSDLFSRRTSSNPMVTTTIRRIVKPEHVLPPQRNTILVDSGMPFGSQH